MATLCMLNNVAILMGYPLLYYMGARVVDVVLRCVAILILPSTGPHASVENNTTWHLVADIELIRKTLGIDRWVVFGGSWGATLALVYAQTHPDHAAYLALRGVFLMTQSELDWFYGGGAGQFWPDVWAK